MVMPMISELSTDYSQVTPVARRIAASVVKFLGAVI